MFESFPLPHGRLEMLKVHRLEHKINASSRREEGEGEGFWLLFFGGGRGEGSAEKEQQQNQVCYLVQEPVGMAGEAVEEHAVTQVLHLCNSCQQHRLWSHYLPASKKMKQLGAENYTNFF